MWSPAGRRASSPPSTRVGDPLSDAGDGAGVRRRAPGRGRGVGRDLPAPGHRLSGAGRAGRGGAARCRPGGLARPAGARARQLPGRADLGPFARPRRPHRTGGWRSRCAWAERCGASGSCAATSWRASTGWRRRWRRFTPSPSVPQPSQHAPPVPAAVRASAHTGAGEMAWGRGDIEQARRHHEAALALRRALDDPDGVAQSLHNLGNLALERGDYGQARALHEEALAIRRARGSPRDVALSLSNLGRLAALRGEYGTAHILLEESLRLAAQIGGNLSRAWPLHALGELALLEGDAAGGRRLRREPGPGPRGRAQGGRRRPGGDRPGGGALGGAEPAVRLLGAAEAVRETIRAPQLPTERVHSVRRPWPGSGTRWVRRPSPPPGPPAGAWGWTRRSRWASPWRRKRAPRRHGETYPARGAPQSARARGGGADRAGLLQPGDRRAPGDHGRDGHQSRHAHPEQARPALPDANRRLGGGLPARRAPRALRRPLPGPPGM